jgi:hypothetical protein
MHGLGIHGAVDGDRADTHLPTGFYDSHSDLHNRIVTETGIAKKRVKGLHIEVVQYTVRLSMLAS